jgi:hypothetical protein
MKDVLTGKWRKLHNEELNGLCCASNIVRVNKSRIIEWSGHVECMGKRRMQVLVRNLRIRVHLGDAGINGKIIIRWIFRKNDVVCTEWIELA